MRAYFAMSYNAPPLLPSGYAQAEEDSEAVERERLRLAEEAAAAAAAEEARRQKEARVLRERMEREAAMLDELRRLEEAQMAQRLEEVSC
jgi:hypothetical protein